MKVREIIATLVERFADLLILLLVCKPMESKLTFQNHSFDLALRKACLF